jgi:hypothetical protein
MSFQTSTTSVSANGKTGGTCQTSGPYKSGTSVTVYFKRGDKFPADPTNGKATTWTMVK